ncbi:MAG: hypothetical protein NTU51_09935 [Bacteroidetes bacterium]|nr:hypothetical protein [Bacteroidota bacterium]
MKKIAGRIFRWLAYGFILFLVFEAVLYFLAPVYEFPEPQPFSGDKFFNPYEGLDSSGWKKCNFHFHVREWWGLTAGRNNTPQELYRVYKRMKYDAPQISNYQSISTEFRDSAFYIPVYEHGFGIRKKHQMLIGAKKVVWLDYSLVQSRSQKQHILNLLRPTSEIVAIAHPDWEAGYSLNDMKYLSNYDMLEVLDNNWRSVPQWDAALSSGHAVWILADDDAHNIEDTYQIQRCATYIHSPVVRGDSMVASLKAGRAYGVEIYMGNNWTFEQKAGWAGNIPRLRSVVMKRDTLTVSVSGEVFKVMFIGQDGKIRKSVYGRSGLWYKFAPEDTYIRTEITFIAHHTHPTIGPGDIIYLNPVFRYNGEFPVNDLKAEINWPRTWIYRFMTFGSLIAILWVFRRLRKIRKQS